ncbi:BTAD domain-containing putative transcriptional regulator [Streptomyces sp. NPDC059851]|uniref:AfsR/SARP family transcriptional regulator n=1 Tax=Streptomyces sp. NPDC059851 TaxID=3346971 RepID=UPI003664481D
MRFGVLGPLVVWTADGHPVAVPEAKVRALLARLLVASGEVVSAERLVEDLWAGRSVPARPVNSLHTLVSRLRRALAAAGGEEAVLRRPPGYALPLDPGTVDAGRFAALADRARLQDDLRQRAALYAEGLGLWRGPALADFADEPFAAAAAAGLEEQRLLVVEELAGTRVQLGDFGEAASDVADAARAHPLRERLRAVQMRALYGAGRVDEALEVYQDVRGRLAEELGIEPGHELARLHQQVLRRTPGLAQLPDLPEPERTGLPSSGPAPVATRADVRATPPRADVHAVPPRRTNLPAAPLSGLVGRDGDVADVRALLAVTRLVTLTGAGGVGKTRLALEVARGLVDDQPDGVLLVELAGHARPAEADGPGAVDLLAEVVAAALGVRDASPHHLGPREAEAAQQSEWSLPAGRRGAPARRLAEALSHRRLVLVLDNCEHVVEEAAFLTRGLLSAAPGLRVLATSREPLALSGEQRWPVGPLALPGPRATAAEVLRSDAVRLFEARAAEASPGFTLRESDAAAVAAVCRRTDGIPLALELASTRVRTLGLTGMAERLDDRFGLLTGGPRDAPRRQQTLRSVIDWSWDLLTAAERIVLRRLAVHADGCTLEAAEALCPTAGVKRGEVLDLLARLVDRNLVVAQVDGAGPPRYRLLESVTAYCVERMEERPTHGSGSDAGTGPTEYEELRRAHAQHYTRLAEEADPSLRGPEQERWLEVLDAETANFRCALDWALTAGDARLARRLAGALTWYWFLRGRLGEAGRATAAALALPWPPGTDADPDGYLLAARQRALDLLSGAPAPVCGNRPADDATRTAPTDRPPGGGGPPGPEGRERSVSSVRSVRPEGYGSGNRAERARSLWFLGHATTLFSAMEAGEDLVHAALEEFRALDDDWGVAAALTVRAVQRSVRGELAAARGDGEEGLRLFRRTGDRWGQLQAGAVLGRLAEAAGDYATAGARHAEGLQISEDLGLWTEASVRRAALGRIALLRQDYRLADLLHRQARQLAVEQGDRPAQEIAEVGLALSARRQGRPEEAETRLRPWLEWNRKLATATGTALVLAELGFAAEQRGDAAAALALHREGLAAARRTNDPRAVALAFEGLAGAHVRAGRPGRAARLLADAARLRASVGAPLPPAERGDVDRITAALHAEQARTG